MLFENLQQAHCRPKLIRQVPLSRHGIHVCSAQLRRLESCTQHGGCASNGDGAAGRNVQHPHAGSPELQFLKLLLQSAFAHLQNMACCLQHLLHLVIGSQWTSTFIAAERCKAGCTLQVALLGHLPQAIFYTFPWPSQIASNPTICSSGRREKVDRCCQDWHGVKQR